MPVPETKNVGTLIKFFQREKSHWKKSRILAAALNAVRRAGAKIKKKQKKT